MNQPNKDKRKADASKSAAFRTSMPFDTNPFIGNLGPNPSLPGIMDAEGLGIGISESLTATNPFLETLDTWSLGIPTGSANELNRLAVPFFSGENNYTSLGAFQSDGEKWGNAVLGFGKGMIGGFVDSVAAWDVEGMYDMAMGNHEKEFGNWLNQSGIAKWAKDMEGLEIYSTGDSMLSTSYWAKQLQTQGYTAGIIAEMLVEQAALALLTGGTGNAASLAGLTSKVRLLKMGGQASFGMLKGIQEGYINALETAHAVEEKYKSMGYSDEITKQKASEAATLNFRTEIGPLMVLNGLQYASMFGRPMRAFGKNADLNTGFSGLTEGIFGRAAGNIGNKYVRGGAELMGQGISEGLEEVIQTTVGQYAERETLKSTFDADYKSDYMNQETLDSFIAGFIGGGMFTAGGNALNKLTENTKAKKIRGEHINFVNDAVTRTVDTFKKAEHVENEYKRAKTAYAKEKSKANAERLTKARAAVKEAQYNSHLTNTVNALQLDYITGNTNAFDSHINQMQEILDAVESQDLDTLKKYHLLDEKGKEKYNGSFETIKKNFKQNIEDSNRIKSMVENNLLNVTSDFESAFEITKKEYMNIKNLEEVNNFEQGLSALYSKDQQFAQMSQDGQRRFKLEAELESMNYLEKLSDTNKQRKEEIKEELAELPGYSAKDSRVAKTINMTPYVTAHTSITSLEQAVDDNNTQLGELRNIKNIQKNVEAKRKKAIAKAKTKQEVDEAVNKAEETGTKTPEVEAQANKKKSEIAAESTLTNIDPKFENKPSGVQEGTKEQDDTDRASEDRLNNLLNSGGATSTDTPETLGSPRNFNEQNINDEARDQIKSVHETIASRLDSELGREATFQDFINDKIEKTSLENVDDKFEAYKYAWKLIGRDIGDAGRVYNTVFNADSLSESLLETFLGTEEVKQETKNTVDNAIKKNSKTSEFDKDNRPVDKDGNYTKDGRTAISHPKASHLGVQYVEIERADGTIIKQPVLGLLNEGQQITNHYILDEDYIHDGTELEIMVPDNVNDVRVADWEFKDNRWRKKETTFGEWVAKHNVEVGSVKYNNKLPMVAVKDGVPVFFIHDTDWYNQSNIAETENQMEIIKDGKSKISQIRSEVLNGNTTIEVNERKFGSLMILTDLKDESQRQPIPLSEATGDTRLAVANKYDELQDGNAAASGSINSQLNLVNNLEENRFHIGGLYEIRKVNTNQYIAMPTMSNDPTVGENINQIAYNNVKYATLASVLLNGSNVPVLVKQMEQAFGMTLSKAKTIQDEIKRTTGIDIKYEVADYVGMFTKVENFNSNLVTKLEDNSLGPKGNPKYPSGVTYMSIDNNVIKMKTKDGKPVERDNNGRDKLRGINLTAISDKSAPIVISILYENFNEDTGIFSNAIFDVSKTQLNKNKEFTAIDSNGTPTSYKGRDGGNTYESYIKDSVRTNVKSFPIKTKDGKTKWITDVQPMVYYGLKNESTTVQSTEDRAQQAAQAAQEELDNDPINEVPEELKDDVRDLLKGIDDASDLLDLLGFRRELTDDEVKQLEDILDNSVSSISPIQQKKLVDSLFNLIISDLDVSSGTVNLADVKSKIDNSLETYLRPQIEKVRKSKEALEATGNTALQPIIDKFEAKINQLEQVFKESSKIISDGNGKPKGDLYRKFERFLAENLAETEDLQENENGEIEFSFSKSSLEKDVKLSFSNNLKIFFANIKKQKKTNKEEIKNFAYLNDFESVDDVIGKLTELMVGLPSSIEELTSILETKVDDPVYSQILHKLKNASEEIQNEILYKMIQSKLDMYMVLYSFNKEMGTYSLKILNSNSAASDVKLKQQWNANFINSELLRTVDDERVLNPEPIKKLISDIDAISKNKITQADFGKVKNLFNRLGIELSDNTIKRIIDTQGNNIFTSSGVLGVMKNTLNGILNKNAGKDKISVGVTGNNPYDNAKGVIEALIDLEIDTNGTRVSKSFRIGSKTIQGAIQKMMVYDVKEQLKDTNSPLFKALKQIPYSQRNFVLTLLEKNEKFKEHFDVSFVSLESIKQHKQKVYDDRKINKLSTTDNMLTQYAFFQNTLKELGEALEGSNLQFKMGHMFNPALSDKEQMILYATALLDLNYKNFDTNNADVRLSDEVVEFMTEQIYMSEFDRIAKTYSDPTNIKNYDGAAKRFLSIPALNEMKNEEGANIHDIIKMAANNAKDLAPIRDIFYKQAKDIIRATVDADVKSKLDLSDNSGTWFDNGFMEYDRKTNSYTLKYMDNKYLKSKRAGNRSLDTQKLAQIAAYDFVVNQYLNQNNTYQLFAGDMALYAPNIKKFTNKETGVVNNIAFTKAVGESITKRMAMLIAPGNKLANSYGDKYLQIMVNDPVKITSTARELIKQYYGSVSEKNAELLDRLNQIENSIRNLYNSRRTSEAFEERLGELESTRDDIMSQLADENTDIAGYFNIEGTDAQEYTTWKEHMDILFRQGRLTSTEKSVLQAAYNKLSAGEDLSPEEIKVVMNPIKPVYAGNVIHRDKNDVPDVNRIVYIKSSSFPLLPQLTRDFKLDKVRRQMEALERKEGKNVRLSYQTANKVGAINTKLTINDLYNIPFAELAEGKLKDATLELDRNNFKIQQDTPYKTAKYLKQNKDDMSTMGSQMWKIILGNGINKIDRAIFPNVFGTDLIATINRLYPNDPIIPQNGMVDGKALDKIKFHAEKMYFDLQRELLYDELGLNNQGFPIDSNESTRALYKLLQKEVTTRQYPEHVIDSLELVEDEHGNVDFAQPLWLSTGSNKFESLLNSVISNRLININLPGNGHIASSSEGFERITNTEEVDKSIMSQVVWLEPNHTGELKATRHENGNLKEAEVLIQSKFRVTKRDKGGKLKTELIDLTSPEYSRTNLETGMLELNLDMIDPELLTQFSYRIPTSSHQSGAILRVVGFLPEASGDMLVVPKEHTQQIGEDFDIDKRWVYKSNYTVDKYGYISKINYETHPEAELADYFLALFDNDEINEALDTNERKEKKVKIKMLENAMIDVYKSVFTSPDNEVQKKVNKILSFDNASDTANLINDRLNSNVDESNFTLFSDDYQRQQMKLGADGKVGIGIHSNAVTFQAQMERLAEHVIMQEAIFDDEGNPLGYVPKYLTIGNYTSDGALGRIETLDGSRSIADVHTENQNSATDNIKAQIMGKRNENIHTMNVLVQLTLRGFDMDNFSRVEGYSQIHVPSLFISQPIIRRYVELMEKNKSITSEFTPDIQADILQKLIAEFDTRPVPAEMKGNLTDAEYARASARMTGDTLYDNLINEDNLKTWDSEIQLAVLKKFMELQEESKEIGEFQSLVNSYSTRGLGISYFNVLKSIEKLERMAENNSINNLRALVGDFIPKDEALERDDNDYIPIPYTDIAIKPTTTEGNMLVNALVAAVRILDKQFPYKSTLIESAIEAVKNNKLRDLTDGAELELSYTVISNIRDFFYSNEALNMFTGNVEAERARLFFDTNENTSLASFLKGLQVAKHPIMEDNELLKAFSFDAINKVGKPSIIKHESDFSTNFDKTDKYNAFLELIKDDTTDLGMFNGQPMTPRKLAQDLATYAFLANNEKGAIGFRDFINVKYLNVIGASKALRDNQMNLNDDYTSSNFLRQFYQHNPEEAFIMSPSNTVASMFSTVDDKSKAGLGAILNMAEDKRSAAMSGWLRNLESFTFKEDTGHHASYIAVRNTQVKKTDNQYSLYEWNGSQYVRIPVLGDFGYNEFNPSEPNQISHIKGNPGSPVLPKPTQSTPTTVKQTVNVADVYKLTSVGDAMNHLAQQDNRLGRFAQILLPFIDPNTKMEVKNVKLEGFGEVESGVYHLPTNTITIAANVLENVKRMFPNMTEQEIMGEIVLEETIHSITAHEMKKFMNEDGSLKDDSPVFMTKLFKLYEIARDNMPPHYYTTNVFEFVAGVFVDNEFRQMLDSNQYRGKTLLEKFKDVLKDMINYLTGRKYTDEVINTVYDLLKYSQPQNAHKLDMNLVQQQMEKDREIDRQLEEERMKGLPTTVQSIANFSRASVQQDSDYLYLFTDNAGRTSGKTKINKFTWYTEKYGNGNYPTMTQAVIRGLENAAPITTMVDDKRTQWTETRFDEYKKIIDSEIEDIKKLLSSGKYKGIKYSGSKQIGQGTYSKLPTKLQQYLDSKLLEIGIRNNNEPPSIDMSKFTSGGDSFDFRLPEIKNCK